MPRGSGFYYKVDAVVTTSTGAKRVWLGDVHVNVRADSSQGLAVLHRAVLDAAQTLVRGTGETLREVKLTRWGPRPVGRPAKPR